MVARALRENRPARSDGSLMRSRAALATRVVSSTSSRSISVENDRGNRTVGPTGFGGVRAGVFSWGGVCPSRSTAGFSPATRELFLAS